MREEGVGRWALGETGGRVTRVVVVASVCDESCDADEVFYDKCSKFELKKWESEGARASRTTVSC